VEMVGLSWEEDDLMRWIEWPDEDDVVVFEDEWKWRDLKNIVMYDRRREKASAKRSCGG